MFRGPFYHSHIRNTIVAFGSLFSNIHIIRNNRKTGEDIQTLHVPIAYSQKEKWVLQIEQNPNDTPGTYTVLPKMGFEITGYMYDSARKLPKMNRVSCPTPAGDSSNLLLTPVPYNIDLALYIATKTQEDALQILEQILPFFAPAHTVTINAIPQLNITQDIPFVLQGVSVQDDYEGDFEMRRFVIHTLNFQAKINLFSGVSDKGVIKQVEASTGNQNLDYVATQPTIDSVIAEEWMGDF